MTDTKLRRRVRLMNDRTELKELINYIEDAVEKFAAVVKTAKEREQIARLLRSDESITSAEKARERVVVGSELLAKVLTDKYEKCSASTKRLLPPSDLHDLVGCMLLTLLEEDN